ncbi:uncharacterized protein LOC128545856 [Mercenaria mercenaria]|uniref:uncharacterized protein LOC128545856 n=1 Tax=Mercenaria mercenaria TaxID=6596 RepID=UPI00234E8CCA|nr:uncharacterized protein LOC128545856 [Mercenaria mercenaria]XP_053372596.1 uncharacterized protein LOC128545856 [Mercenaria mercenaria]XP_053372597.1 uncharacterized protein LOC128545856 [Mercenaria mercenaria]XP_053372598.1 uncharacterized protein LOC128545856 [Mercenaria mercenaria]
MTAVLGRTEVGIRQVGGAVTVANDPKARLMYYLNCMCSVLDLSDTANMTRLRNYKEYSLLTEAETDALITLGILLSPDELCGKVIFQDEALCGESSNRFYEISAVHRDLLVSDSIIIGGKRRTVSMIMAFKPYWLVKNWVEPMQYFAPRLSRIAGAAPARTRYSGAGRTQRYSENTPLIEPNSAGGCCCTIL